MTVRQSLFYSLMMRYFGFIIQFTTNIVISRLLMPDEIGVYSLSLMGLGIVQALREFGVSRYLVQEKNLTEDSIRTAFGMMILISWSFAILVFFARGIVADFYLRPELSSIIAVLLINFIIVPFGLPANALLTRKMEFRKIFIVVMASAIANAVVGISFAYNGFSSMSLAYAAIASTGTNAGLALYFEPTHLKLRPSLKNWRQFTSYGVFSVSSSVINTVGGSTAELVLGKVLTFTAVGLYSRANGLLTVLQNNLIAGLTRVAFPGFAKLLREGEKIEGKYLQAVSFLTGFLWPIYMVLLFSSGALIVFLFGDVWAGATGAAQVLCLNGMVMVSFTLLQSVYYAHGVVRRQLVIEIVVQTFRIIFIFSAAPYGIAAVAWAQTAASVINGMMYHLMLRSHFDVSLAQYAYTLRKSAMVTVITGLAMAAAFLILDQFPHGNLVTLITSAVVGICSWVVGVRVTGHEIGPEMMVWVRTAGRKIRRR